MSSAIRRPEHVGPNRCWPCTVANAFVLAAVCLGLLAVDPLVGVAVAVLGTLAIWLRGYLIPFTPRFAPRLAARLPGDPFHVADSSAVGASGEPQTDRGVPDGGEASAERRGGSIAEGDLDGEAVVDALLGAGVLEPAGEDLALTDEFAARWRSEIQTLRESSPEDLADAAREAAPEATAADVIDEHDRTYVALAGESGDPLTGTWLRRPVAIAETAGVRALAAAGVDADRRAPVAHSLVLFLDDCPVCDAALDERLAGACCGPPLTDADGEPLRALVCPDCEVQFVTA